MGATNFHYTSSGPTAQEAFTNAVKEAQWEYGHGGYTGTIAEKTTFTMVSDMPLSSGEADRLANSLMDTDYGDKWGPAGCIELATVTPSSNANSAPRTSKIKRFLFFGWASS